MRSRYKEKRFPTAELKDGKDFDDDVVGDGGEYEGSEEEDEGEVKDRMSTRAQIYGDDYMKKPGFIQNYVTQWQINAMATTTAGSWKSIGPTTSDAPYVEAGRIRTVLQHSTNKNTVFMLSSGGGLWRTYNFFDKYPSWIPLTNNLFTTSGGGFALGRSSDTIYLGLGDSFSNIGIGGLFTISSDSGDTWSTPIAISSFQTSTFATATTILEVKVDLSEAIDIVLVSTNIGIFYSNNAGISFTFTYSGGATYYGNVESIVKTSLGWIGYDKNEKDFILSTNKGASWYTPSGSNWNSITGGLAHRTTFAIGSEGDSIVYAVSAKSNSRQLDVFRSTDGGLTWIALGVNEYNTPINPISGLQTTLNILDNQGWYDQMLIVDPTDSNIVYLGGQGTSAKTSDGGSTWSILTTWHSPTSFNLPYVHADFHYGTFLTSSTGIKWLVFGTDGGLFTSADDGVTFTNELNRGISTHLAQYIGGTPHFPGLFLLGLQDLGTRARLDNTTTEWNRVFGGDGEGCGFSQARHRVMIVSYYENNFLCAFYDSSSNSYGGLSYCRRGISLSENLMFFTNLAVPLATADSSGEIFFTITYQSIYKSSISSSNRVTWTKIGTNGITSGLSSTVFRGSYHMIGVGISTTNTVAVAKDQELAITTNGGSTWRTVNLRSFIGGWAKTASPLFATANGKMMYVASENTAINAVRLIKSTDSGVTWTAASSGLPDVPITKIIVNTDDPTGSTVYAAAWIGVYMTRDGGENWEKMGSGLPSAVVNDIYRSPNHLHIATYGRGVWELSITDLAPTATPTSEVYYMTINMHMTGITANLFSSSLMTAMKYSISNITQIDISYINIMVSDITTQRLRNEAIINNYRQLIDTIQIDIEIIAPDTAYAVGGGYNTILNKIYNTALVSKTFISIASKISSTDISLITIISIEVSNTSPTQMPTQIPTTISNTKSELNSGVIIGSVLGSFFGFIFIGFGLFMYFRSKSSGAVIFPS